jgi:hypothetical protein
MPNVLLAAGPAMSTSSTAMLICVAETPGALPGGDWHPEWPALVATGPLAAPTECAPPAAADVPAAAAPGTEPAMVVDVVVDVVLALPAPAVERPAAPVVPRPSPKLFVGTLLGTTAHIRAESASAAATTVLTFWKTGARRNHRRRTWNDVIGASSTTRCALR